MSSSPPRFPSSPPLPQAIGRYEIVRVLGEGAMGRVLLAHDPVLDRDVALKHLRGDLRIPRDLRQSLLTRMRHEARAAARVPHPSLVMLHDMGEDPEVGLYLVFEYVEGPTLKQRLVDDGRLPPGEAAKLAADLGSALTITHEAGILHRDIKPENVMLSRTGGKIADFGIARIPDSTLTQQGGLMGTPAYSAPETFRGGVFSPASDQFSLAATLYEAISGRRAFPGDDAVTVAARIQRDDPERFARALGLPPAVDEILARALSRTPDDRYPSCDAFGAALARSLAPLGRSAHEAEASSPTAPGGAAAILAGVAAGPPGSPPALAADPPRERRTGQVVMGAVVVVVVAAALIHAALRSAEAPPEQRVLGGTAAPSATEAARPHRAPTPRPPAPARSAP